MQMQMEMQEKKKKQTRPSKVTVENRIMDQSSVAAHCTTN